MSARQLLDRVEETGLVDAKTLSKLRREIENSAKEIKLPALAKFLVEKGHMTKSQVDRLIAAIKADDDELTAADIAPPKGMHNTDTLTMFASPGKKTDKPSAIDGLTEVVPVELIEDGTRIYGIDEVIEHDRAVEVEVEVEQTRVLGALDNDPLFGGSELAMPGTDVAFGGSMEAGGRDRQPATGFRGKVDTGNQWQTKWLFLGFGLLSVVVILGAVLVLALSGESAENALKSAEDQFGKGAYLDAAKKYNEFYTKFTSHEDIGYAKVREVQSLMAAPYERKNFSEVFAIAQEHLPKIIDQPTMDVFRDASSTSESPIGRINPFSVPAQTRIFTGRPTIRKMAVDKTMKATIVRLVFASMRLFSVFIKDTDVNAAPTTEVIAAAHITTPNMRKPTVPAAF